MGQVFINLSLIILAAVLVSALMRILRQPLIIGYIFTGILVGPYLLDLISESATLETFSQIGVALLLFTVGLHLNPRVIKEVGKVSLITGIGQVVFTFAVAFLISMALGFSTIVSFYVSIALAFSSTIIIMKLISDKGDMDSVYGKISIGFLIVQDLIAIIILMVISSSSGSANLGGGSFFEILLYGTLSIIVLLLFSWKILPKILKKVARSQEFLFLFSIGWCLIIASWFYFLDFSLEIGALLAGITLSTTSYSNEISSKMRPLRDFFIVVFFIVIGSQMVLGDISQNIVPIVIFSLLVLIGNPLIVLFLTGRLGYTKRTGFLSGLTVSQISEFSIILVALGISVGHLSSEILSIITVVALITIAGSTYSITYSNWIYSKLSKYLGIFEKKSIKRERDVKKSYDAILFGYNRIGFSILNALKSVKKKYLVVDFNPDTISTLNKFKIPCLYGDVDDVELLSELPLDKIKLAVSTIPDFEANYLLIEEIRKVNRDASIVVRAHSISEALDLYSKGASYVLTPHFLGGEYISKMINELGIGKEKYVQEKKKHIKMLKEMEGTGKDHPKTERN